MPLSRPKQTAARAPRRLRATRQEALRLATLRGYEILDTPPEAAFDRIARLAARMLRVPISLVSLMEEKRQWFKASCGLEITETPRDISFCRVAIESEDVTVIPDTLLDERFAGNPLVLGPPFVRFYAGAPLRSSNGMILGTVCVIDLRPRRITQAERQTLADLAATVVDELDLRRAAAQLHREVVRRDEAERSLSAALSSVEAQVKARTAELSKSNEQLRVSETQFRELAENVQEAFWMFDPVQNATHYVNPAWQRIWQRPRPPLGDPSSVWVDSLHPEDRERVLRDFQERAAEGIEVEYRILWPDGTIRWLHDRTFPIRDATGQVYRVAGIATDITERKNREALVQLRARQQQVVAELGAFALTGGEVDELLRRSCQIVQETLQIDFAGVAEHLPEQGEFVSRAMVGETAKEMIGLRIPNGTRSGSGYALLTGEPVISLDLQTETRFQIPPWAHKSGTRSGAIVLIGGGGTHLPTFGTFNVSSRQLRAFPPDDVFFLQSVANVLASAISRRRGEEALRVAKEEAELANSAKSSFLSRISHELRTPLNSILGFSQLLQMDVKGERPQECLRHVIVAGQQLLTMIDDVLDISRLELGRGTFVLEPVPVREAICQVMALVRPLAAPHLITVETMDADCCNCTVLANRQRLNQILLNLLANAIKYNRPEGRVTVTCHDLPSARLRISITDTGHGIAPEDLARLYVPFDRLGAERTSVPGTGLGLALCKNLVEAQGGKIGVESTPGVGSTFWITLPVAPPLQQPTSGQSESNGHGVETHPRPPLRRISRETSRSILYIEDNLSNLRLIERLLQGRRNIKLRTATCGRDGLRLARRALPDLVLLDNDLPDISGREVLHAMKTDPVLEQIPVVVVSADALPSSIEQLRSAGARDYLTKPLDVHRLMEMLAKLA